HLEETGVGNGGGRGKANTPQILTFSSPFKGSCRRGVARPPPPPPTPLFGGGGGGGPPSRNPKSPPRAKSRRQTTPCGGRPDDLPASDISRNEELQGEHNPLAEQHGKSETERNLLRVQSI